MSKLIERSIHRRTILFQHDLDSNVGEQEAWVAAAGCDWGNPHYVELTGAAWENLYTIQEFRYGVLTLDAWCNLWTDVLFGFLQTGAAWANNVGWSAGNFQSNKHNTGNMQTAITLTNSEWYHFIITWNPQFVQMEIYTLLGVLAGFGRHRNPPNVPLHIWCWIRTIITTVFRLGAVTVQDGDDPVFFNLRG